MMKQLKSLLSILCAIALLVSGMTFALADEENAETPAAEVNTAAEAPAAPAQQPAAPAQEPAAPAKEPAAPAQEPAAPAQEPAAPAQEPAAPAKEPTAPAQEPAAPAQEPAAPAQEPAAPAQEPAAPAQEPAAPAEEPAAPAEEPAASAEEPAAPAQDEGEPEAAPAEDGEETSSVDGETVTDDGLYVLDDNWGHIDPEAMNVPEITDELKGLRNAELYVGDSLSDTLEFGDELTIALKGCSTSTVELRLYVSANASIHTKVDGKAVGFTPADSDVPSMNMYVYELANAAGRSHDIVLSSSDTASFRLTAVAGTEEAITEENTAENETPASEENNTPAEEPAANTASGNAGQAETPAPTIQASVKTYTLKPGSSVSDSLIGGQKARIQVKCGKNENVTLTLRADSDNVVVTIDGGEARFVSAGAGTYTCELTNVPFRKFNVSISAKQDTSFTLSAVAVKAAAEEKKEEVTDKPAETEEAMKTEPAEEEKQQEEIPAAEKADAEELAAEEGAEEQAVAGTENETGSEGGEEETKPEVEDTNEDAAEETGDETEEQPAEGSDAELTDEEPAEEASEEKTEEAAEEETKEETAEGSEEEKEEVSEEKSEEETAEETEEETKEESEEETEEESEEESEEVTEEESEEESEEETEEETEEESEEETEEESEEENEEETAEGLTDEQMAELGYRKVRIANENGADIYAAAEEEAEATGHADAGTELWIKDAEAEGWAEIYTAEEEAAQFILLADIERVKTIDEQMAELGYRKVQILNENGADIYAAAEDEAEVTGHTDYETELWIKDAEAEGWAEIYTAEEEAAQFIRLADIEHVKTIEEQLAELGYRKTRVMNEEGADIYAAAEEEAEVIGHADFEAELWIKDAEAEGWAEIYAEEETAQFVKLADLEHEKTIDEILTELGYRKVQVLNENGADIYAAAEEEAEVIGHADFEAELWIKDAETEGWAEIYTEEETAQFVKLADLEHVPTFEELMLAAGYWRAQVALADGADVFSEMNEESAVVEHLDFATEIWIKVIRGTGWAEVYYEEEDKAGFIQCDALVITLKNEDDDDEDIRSVVATTSLEGVEFVYYGTPVELTAELFGFAEDDEYLVQWMYSPDERENFYNVEEATELTYTYDIDEINENYIWKIVITLLPKE